MENNKQIDNTDIRTETDPVLSSTKEMILFAINNARALALMSGVVFKEHVYDTSPNTVSMLTSIISAAKITQTDPQTLYSWRTKDNITNTFLIDELVELLSTMVSYTQTIYKNSWAHKEIVSSLTTLPDLWEYVQLNNTGVTSLPRVKELPSSEENLQVNDDILSSNNDTIHSSE
jgi:hypothetical protein